MGCLQCDPPMYPGCARMVLICKDQVFLFCKKNSSIDTVTFIGNGLGQNLTVFF